MSTPEIVRLKKPVTEQDHASGPETAPVTLLEYGNFECIHCGQAYPVLKQLENFLVTICASSFVTSPLFRHIRTLCGQRRPLKLLVRKRSSGRCTTNYLRTKQRWRIVIFHATPDALVLVRRDSRTI